MSLAPLFDPSILFFVVGIAAGLMKSSLEIPVPIARFLSLYLLMALGLKGGFALAQSGFTLEVLSDLGIAIALAVIVPLLCYAILRRVIGGFDAAAISATYGSVSAVTFITATQFLEKQGLEYGGHMAAAMALMESPAIIFAVLMANVLRRRSLSTAGGDPLFGQTYALLPEQVPKSRHGVDENSSLGAVLKESFTEGAQILLLGSMLIGLLTGDAGKQIMEPFTGQLFKGMLAFFLLDMGIATASRMADLGNVPKRLLLYGVLAPPCHALIAIGLCAIFNIPAGNAALLAVLAASASYIAVPAVLKHAIPEASPVLYLGMSLGLTFPLNIIVGIPLYVGMARWLLG
ncbi:MAG: sodium-dependent bicarbonate transport family permease [Burkholderiaceae bacterium]|jgi:hypothetical protein